MRAISFLLSGLIGSFLLTQYIRAEARAEVRILDWQTFEVPEFGTRVEYPARIFTAVGEAEKGVGRRFESKDGRAILSIYARENEDDDTPASYLRKNLRQRTLDYERVTRSFFAISSERDGIIYYSRCNFSRPARGSLHCFDLVYPQAEKRAWDSRGNTHQSPLRPLER